MASTTEYSNFLTSNRHNIYAVPPQYNTLIAQKLPATVPSQSYPTILVQNQKEYGYNALTHDSDQMGYYSLTTAYGNKCEPSYIIAKCPENRVIRPFNPSAPIANVQPSTSMYVAEGFVNPPHKISFYTDDNCKHCKKALDEYKNSLGKQFDHQFIVKNVKDPRYKKELTDMGAKGLPFFVSSDQKQKVLGYHSLPDLMSNFQSSSPSASSLTEELKKLKLVVFSTPNCPYCNKFKDMLGANISVVQFARENHPLYKQVKGYPFILSEQTKKSYLGAPPSLQDLIHSLSN